MRLKQLLGFSLPLVLCVSAVAAPVTQLTELRVQPQGSGTTVAIEVNGAFTHTEYRPAEDLLLVDLPGVQPGHFANKNSSVNLGGVQSYRVQTFRGASGDETTRVEISLATHSVVTVDKKANTLLVQVSGSLAQGTSSESSSAQTSENSSSQTPATASATSAVTTTENDSPAETRMVSSRPGVISGVAIKRSANGIDVEVKLDHPLTPRILTLTNPNRIVLDLPAVATTQRRNISVNSDLVKGVRMARRQNTPPVTRIVVDLATPSNYEISPAGKGFALHLTRAESGASASRHETQTAEHNSIAAETSPAINADTHHIAKTPAGNQQTDTPAASVATTVNARSSSGSSQTQPAQNASMDQALFQIDPSQTATLGGANRADAAAAHFASASTSIPLSNLDGTQGNALLQPAVLPAMQSVSDNGGISAMPTTCNSTRYTGEPISLKLKEADIRDFFSLIHEISGLNVVLDSDVRGTLTIVLDDVPWDQALSIVLRNNRLDCELQGNVLRIASTDTIRREADARRAAIEAVTQSVEKITVNRYLSYANADQAKAILMQFMSPRGTIVVDKRTNSLIISDIPNVIPNLDRLIKELDRKTPEVEIEARVVSTTRAFARDIGTQLGFGWGNVPSAVGGAGSPSPITVGALAPLYLTKGNSIPLFSNHPANNINDGISITNETNTYRLDFILSLAETKGLSKLLSRPRVTTQNNTMAIVRQGQQIPVVTAGQLGGPPTTTYVNAFLRLQVTPQITAEGTIFLNIDVENTTADFSQEVLGQPTLNTQQATTQVLVTNGGTVMIGGVVQTTSSVSTDQFPLLGDIPVLGNLFKHRAVSTSTAELIFFITPKIVNA